MHEQRVVAVQIFLARYENDGTKLLEPIVTSDKSWIYYWTSEMKDEPSLRKFKMKCTVWKVMLMALYDCLGLIYTEFGTDVSKTRPTIILVHYCTCEMPSRSRDTGCSRKQCSFSTTTHVLIVRN